MHFFLDNHIDYNVRRDCHSVPNRRPKLIIEFKNTKLVIYRYKQQRTPYTSSSLGIFMLIDSHQTTIKKDI